MDDASRFITCYGVFDSATTENTIKVLKKGFAEYGIPMRFLPIVELSLLLRRAERELNTSLRILARINPQTNGKIERFFGLMGQKQHLLWVV